MQRNQLSSYTIDRAVLWCLQITEGLEALQEADIFYSNLTLADVLLTQADGNVVLSGFDLLMRDHVNYNVESKAGDVQGEGGDVQDTFDTRDQSLRLGVIMYQIMVAHANDEDEEDQRAFFGEMASKGQVAFTLRQSALKAGLNVPDGVVEIVEGLIRLEGWRRMPWSCVVDRLRMDAAASVAKMNFGKSVAKKIPSIEEIRGSAGRIRVLERKMWKGVCDVSEDTTSSKGQEEVKLEQEEPVDLVAVWRELADAYDKQGQGYRALEIHHDVVRYVSEPGKPADLVPVVVESWEAMAKVYQRQGSWQNSRSAWEVCVAARKKDFVAEEAAPGEVARLAACLDNLGVVRQVLGQKEAAMRDYSTALELLRTKDRNDEAIRQVLPSVLGHLGTMHRSKKDYDRAMSLIEEALDLRRRWGPVTGIAGCLIGLAGVYQDRNELELAFQLLHKAETRLRKEEETPARNLALADVLQRCGYLNLSQRNLAKARECHQEALDLRRKGLPPQHPDIAVSLQNLALLHEKAKDFQQAAQSYKEAADIRLMSLPEAHPDTANSLHGLGIAYQLVGLKVEALDAYEKALEIRRRLKGVDAATTLNNMAGVYQSMRDYPMAMKCLQEATRVYQMSGDHTPHSKEAMKNTARNIESIKTLLEGHGYVCRGGEWMHREECQQRQQQQQHVGRSDEEFKEEVVQKRPQPQVQSKAKPKPKEKNGCTVM